MSREVDCWRVHYCLCGVCRIDVVLADGGDQSTEGVDVTCVCERGGRDGIGVLRA